MHALEDELETDSLVPIRMDSRYGASIARKMLSHIAVNHGSPALSASICVNLRLDLVFRLRVRPRLVCSWCAFAVWPREESETLLANCDSSSRFE
jgi:hypothetical protein